MQHKTIRTSAFVASHYVLTALHAFGVVLALVRIQTIGTGDVQLESSGADASEAAQGVEARSRLGTQAWILLTLVYV